MKLGLGTVQFGCNYGISNKNGQVPLEEVSKILGVAYNNGIDVLDTAQAYGTSEKTLGEFDLSKFKVVTKIVDPNSTIETSLSNLKIESLYGLMLHHEDMINDSIWKTFQSYKEQKLVKKIGISVYNPEVLLDIINNYDIDIVQFPLNLFDQRFIEILPCLKEKNIEIHTRSTFLQGLLLMNASNINKYFDEIKNNIMSIPEPRLVHCLQFIKNISEVDKIIVGATNCNELKQIIESFNSEIEKFDYNKLKIDDKKYILPQNWRV